MNLQQRKEEILTIAKIADRAENMGISPTSRITLMMDLRNTNDLHPLELDRMLVAKDGDFAHDVIGIQNNFNRETCEMDNFFLPRFSKKEVYES